MKKLRSILLLLKLLTAALMIPDRLAAQYYLIHNYTESDGMSSSMVNDVTQDSLGRMWFAGRTGVALYDGYHWENLTGGHKTSFKPFSRILTDRRGCIWALAISNPPMLMAFPPDSGSAVTIPLNPRPSSSPHSVAVDYWQDSLVVAAAGLNDDMVLYHDGQWHHPLASLNPKPEVREIINYRNGFLMATDRGLLFLDEHGLKREVFTSIKLPDQNLQSVFLEADQLNSRHHRLWILGRQWVGYIEENKLNLIDIPWPDILDSYIHSEGYTYFLPDGGQGVYLSRIYNYYYHLGTGEISRLGTENGFTAGRANGFYQDREGNIWMPTDRGVSKLVSMRFANFNRSSGLMEDEVASIAQRKSGEMILGHNFGFTRYDGRHFITSELANPLRPADAQQRIMDMTVDEDENVWMAASDHGLARLNRDNHVDWIPNSQLPGAVSAVCIDREGVLWIGGNGGIRRFKAGRIMPAPEVIPRDIEIRRIIQDARGALYFAAVEKGVFRYFNGKIELFSSPDSPATNNTFNLYELQDGTVLVGSINGLYSIQNDRLMPYALGGQKIDRPVFGMIQDSHSCIWVGTDMGLYRLNRQGLKHYHTRHGFIGRETNRDAFFIDSEQRLWLGSEMGVSRYQPEYDRPYLAQPPIVRILGILIGDNRYDLSTMLNLSHEQNSWLISFYGNSMRDEKSLEFQIRLEGFENDWYPIDLRSGRQLRYTNLAPGRYRIHLKAKSIDNVWSDAVVSPWIVIANPFWKSPWFYLSIAVTLLLLLGFTVKYVSDKRHARDLESLVQRRTEQLRKSEAQYRLIAENPIDGIALIQAGHVIWINKTFNHLLGFNLDELRQKPLAHYFINHDSLSIDEISFALKSGQDCLNIYETSARHKSGHILYVEVFASQSFSFQDDAHETVLIIVRNITQRKIAENKIQTSLKEKDVLLKEVHHRVKNNLQIVSSLLSLQSRHIDDKKITDIFLQSQSRIRSMALIHEKIYQSNDFANINYKSYVEMLVQGLKQIFLVNRREVAIDLDIDDIPITLDQAIPCGLIINELVSNTFKYAYSDKFEGEKRVSVSMKSTEHRGVELVVADNGQGLAADFDINSVKSLGLKLVNILVDEQLEGSLKQLPGPGTGFHIQFKLH